MPGMVERPYGKNIDKHAEAGPGEESDGLDHGRIVAKDGVYVNYDSAYRGGPGRPSRAAGGSAIP